MGYNLSIIQEKSNNNNSSTSNNAHSLSPLYSTESGADGTRYISGQKKDINAVTGFGRKQGNGAHIMIPKDWIGIELYVTPLQNMQEDAANGALERISIGRCKK